MVLHHSRLYRIQRMTSLIQHLCNAYVMSSSRIGWEGLSERSVANSHGPDSAVGEEGSSPGGTASRGMGGSQLMSEGIALCWVCLFYPILVWLILSYFNLSNYNLFHFVFFIFWNGFQARVGCVQGVQGLREEMRDIVERSEKMREEHSSLLRQSQVSTGMCQLYVYVHVPLPVPGASSYFCLLCYCWTRMRAFRVLS